MLNVKSTMIEVMSLASLKPLTGNARIHNRQNLDAIKSSLEAHGQVEPLLIRNETNEVVGGSGRLLAMRELGWTECRVILLDLDANEATALNLRLNRTAELAAWDMQGLYDQLAELDKIGVDIPELGWPDVVIGTDDIPANLPAPTLPPSFAERIGQEAPQGTHTGASGEQAVRYADDSERPAMARPVHLTVEQREIFERAKAVMISEAADGVPTSSGRALELICADWLAGH